MGADEAQHLCDAIGQEAAVSIRVNSSKASGAKPAGSVDAVRPVPWCLSGYYLGQRPAFTFDPLLHAGCYYVQEASSMFVEQALRVVCAHTPGALTMLDLCAAPGGKSTHARDFLPAGSLLVANEVNRQRSQILAENLTKWGHADVVVTNNNPSDFSHLTHWFDVVLVDAPCSGEGMFRKDEGAIAEWSMENVEICWQRQRRILADIWPCIKPGGYLIYSTCTYNSLEDEENVRWMQREWGAEVVEIPTDEAWNIQGNLLAGETFPVYRFMPHRTQGEGIFMTLLRKPVEADGDAGRYMPKVGKADKKKAKVDKEVVSKEMLAVAKGWVTHADRYEWSAEGGRIVAFPSDYVTECKVMKACLRVLQAGIEVGELKGRDVVPAHALAMSTSCNSSAFAQAELTYGQAIAYLRKEAIVLGPEVPRGWVLVAYRRHALGFVKNIGNRANNLYPQEWRIRSGYVPDEAVEVI